MLFDKLTCLRIEKISSVLLQVRVIFKKFISGLSLLQQISGKLISFSTIRHNVILSSSPKVGICSKRSNLHISSFLRFAPVLWIIDKHCNKLIDPATNKYVGHTPAIYWTSYCIGFLQLSSDCKILTKYYSKKETCFKFLRKNSVSKRNVLIIRSEKNFHRRWTDRWS